jgi:hypothetical protein
MMKIKSLFLLWMIATYCGVIHAQNTQEQHPLRYCNETIDAGIGMGSSAQREVGGAICIDAKKQADFKGENIVAVNIGLFQLPGESCQLFATKDLDGDYLWTQELKDLDTGWNYVKLDHPIALDGSPIYIGVVSYTGCMYLGMTKGKVEKNADWMYYRTGDTAKKSWKHASEVDANKWSGSICIEAMVTGGKASDNEIALSASFNNFENHNVLVDGEPLTLEGSFTNKGYKTINSADVTVNIDNSAQPYVFTIKDIDVPNRASCSFELPTGIKLSTGMHDVDVNICNINGSGSQPSASSLVSMKYNAQNDCYAPTLFVEDFSTLMCGQCPAAMTYLRSEIKGRDDIIMMTHHAGYRTDDYTTPTDSYLAEYFGLPGSPYLLCNRATISQTEQYVNLTGIITYAMKQLLINPSYVKLDQDLKYDSSSRKVTVTVKGDKKSQLDDTPLYLSVYVTETVRTSKAQASAGAGYVSHNTLRAVLTTTGEHDNGGELVEWNGDEFEKTYTYTLPDDYNASNISLIAFVGQGLQGMNTDILYTNEAKLSDVIGTGITNTEVNDAQQIAVAQGRYVSYNGQGTHNYSVFNISGRLVENGTINGNATLGNLPKGLYIIKIGKDKHKFIK